MQAQVRKYVQSQQLINSYDTWHGIVVYYNLGILGKSVKVHLYWAMKNCQGSADTLRDLIENIP